MDIHLQLNMQGKETETSCPKSPIKPSRGLDLLDQLAQAQLSLLCIARMPNILVSTS